MTMSAGGGGTGPSYSPSSIPQAASPSMQAVQAMRGSPPAHGTLGSSHDLNDGFNTATPTTYQQLLAQQSRQDIMNASGGGSGNGNGNGNNDSLNKKKKDSALNLKRSAHTDAAPGSDLSFTVVSQSQHTTSSSIDIDPHEEETEEEEKNSDDAVVVVVSVIDTDTDTAAAAGPVVDNLTLNNDDAHMDADGSFDRIEIVSSLFPMGYPSDLRAAGNANANSNANAKGNANANENVPVTTTTSDADADDSAVPENIDIDIAISPATFDLEDKGCCGMTSS